MANKARHGDLTAQTKARLLEQHSKDQQQAALRMTMIDQQAQERKEGTVDLTQPNQPNLPDVPDTVDLTYDERQALSSPQPLGQTPAAAPEPEIEQSDSVEVADVAERLVTFRVNESIPQVTIGVGNTFDLVEGQKYKAPKSVYDHLEEKGLIYH